MASLFDRTLGHKPQIQSLKKAVTENRWPSSLLFTGPSGVGKFLIAKAMVQYFLCDNLQDHHKNRHNTKPATLNSLSINNSCGTCGSCLRVEKEQNENLIILHKDGLNIKIDPIRDIIHQLSLMPSAKGRFIIIDDAHTMTTQASNALLKSLEEPPCNSFFILVSANLSGLLPTIRSRCQLVRFSHLSDTDAGKLSPIPTWALKSLRGQSNNCPPDDNEALIALRKQAFQSFELILAGEQQAAFDTVKDRLKDKDQSLSMILLWQQLVRDATIYSDHPTEVIHQEFNTLIASLAEIDATQLDQMFQNLLQLETDLGKNLDRSLAVECFLKS